MRHFTLFFIVALTSPAFSAGVDTGSSCAIPLGGGDEYTPGPADLERLVAKILEHSGPDKHFGGIDGGNVGMHAYLIPHPVAARVLEIAGANPHASRRINGFHEKYDPLQNILVGVLETGDDPQFTLMIMPRDPGGTFYRMTGNKLNYDLVDPDSCVELRERLPGAWDADGYFQSAHPYWAMLKDGHEVPLPYRGDYSYWSIERYK